MQRRQPLGHDPFEVGLGEAGQCREVAVQERQAVVVVLQIQAAAHALGQLIDETELAVVVTRSNPVEDRARHVDAERRSLTLLDRERQIEPTAQHIEFHLALVGGHLPLDDVARHVTVDPHDLVTGTHTCQFRRRARSDRHHHGRERSRGHGAFDLALDVALDVLGGGHGQFRLPVTSRG